MKASRSDCYSAVTSMPQKVPQLKCAAKPLVVRLGAVASASALGLAWVSRCLLALEFPSLFTRGPVLVIEQDLKTRPYALSSSQK